MAQDEARQALYEAIETEAKTVKEYGGPTGAAMLRDLAMAFRFTTGGQQPGGLHVEK